MSNKNKALMLYSGGLDSRLVAKILKEKNYDVTAVFFHLPFASDRAVQDKYLENLGITLEIFDCTKGKLLNDFLEMLKKPSHGRGAGYNPCIDCKLFMTNKLTSYFNTDDFCGIATGEVPGQRPMSQTSGKMKIIKEKTSVPLIRPLVDLGFEGRTRKKQIEMAKSYNIDYPSPGGGCLLCEKEFKKRFEILVGKGYITETTLPLSKIGRHYYFEKEKLWFVVGRNKEENDVIEQYKNIITSGKGKPAVYYNHPDAEKKAAELQAIYQAKDRNKIEALSTVKI